MKNLIKILTKKQINIEKTIIDYLNLITKAFENTCQIIDTKLLNINERILLLTQNIEQIEQFISKNHIQNNKINKNFEILSKNLKYSIYNELKEIFKHKK